MNEPLVQITDKSGQVIGVTDMLDAFEKQLIRHTAYVMLMDAEGSFLLQKRSFGAPNYSGYWDASAGGHVDEGENPEIAAYRELSEELGVADVVLNHISSFYFESEGDGRTYRYYAHAYAGTLPSASLPTDLSDEVDVVRLYTRKEIDQLEGVVPIAKRIVGLI